MKFVVVSKIPQQIPSPPTISHIIQYLATTFERQIKKCCVIHGYVLCVACMRCVCMISRNRFRLSKVNFETLSARTFVLKDEFSRHMQKVHNTTIWAELV